LAEVTKNVENSPRVAHFRAHERRAVRLPVGLVSLGPAGAGETGLERPATVIDISLAGAGLEVEEPLVRGERVSLSFATPTLWDPLVVTAVVAWSQPMPRGGGRSSFRRLTARVGVAFEYAGSDVVMSMFEMLTTLAYE
jgi:hypothetical protein